jgi:hypothetical protein
LVEQRGESVNIHGPVEAGAAFLILLLAQRSALLGLLEDLLPKDDQLLVLMSLIEGDEVGEAARLHPGRIQSGEILVDRRLNQTIQGRG